MTAEAATHPLPLVRNLIEAGRADGLHHGAQLYVSQHGVPLAHLALGENQPGEPLTVDHAMLWMSAVKPLTAVALAQWVESGRIDWHDRVADWLPAFAAGGKDGVTLWHLLTHTAGLRGADRAGQPEDMEAALERICATPLEPDWVPGERAGYQIDATWLVLAAVIERVSGERYVDVLRERIFEPLGMTGSYLGAPDAPIDAQHHPTGLVYQARPSGLHAHPLYNDAAALRHVRPGGNGRGPAAALGRFYEDVLAGWLRDESRLLRQDTIRAMTRRQRGALRDETFQHVLDWGLGVMPNNQRHGAQTVPYGFGAHASDDAFGHGGAQACMAFADPAHALVVVVLFNGMPGEPRHQRRMRAVLTTLYEELGLAAAG
jgi:CubicO group peptidase (beta-lactamase class C family)